MSSPLARLKRGSFEHCTSLQTVIVSDGIERIGASVFNGCRSLRGFETSQSSRLTHISAQAFTGCRDLGTIALCHPLVTQSMGIFVREATSRSLCVIDLSEETLLTYRSRSDTCTVPKDLKRIGSSCFESQGFQSIVFEAPVLVTTFQASAFAYCANLKTIMVPKSVELIDRGCFSGCSVLESVAFEPESLLITVGELAFVRCSSLRGLTFPASIERLGRLAFSGATSVESLVFESPSHLAIFERLEFCPQTPLTSICIPASVSIITDGAFQGLIRLEVRAVRGWRVSRMLRVGLGISPRNCQGTRVTGVLRLFVPGESDL
jgi:hypothetical protein